MRKIKEVLRLTWACQQSQRQVARQCSLSRPCVRNYLRRADEAGLSWPLPADLNDSELERLLFPDVPRPTTAERTVPDWTTVFIDMKQKNVTKFLLWQEYRGLHPTGYNYSWFCDNYRRWLGKRDLSMRQNHRAGEKLFIDYAGHTMPVINRHTGEITEVQIFVAVMGASKYLRTVFLERPVRLTISLIDRPSRRCHRLITLNKSTSITPLNSCVAASKS